MANKKKPAPKKPAPKKAAKPAAKPVSHKAVKPAAKRAAPKKAVSPKKTPKPVAAKKPVPKPAAKPAAPVKKPEPAKPVAPKVAVVAKPEPKPVAVVQEEAPKPVVKKSANDPSSLVSIKPVAKPVIKKEPPKAGKIVIPKTTIKSAVKYEPDFTKSVLDTPMYEQNGPSMRYSDADLTEFREIINKKLDAAKKELAYLQGLITRRDEGGDMDEARYMTMEDGSVSMEREQLSQMASRQITFIDHLEKAIMRIENKTYGICRITGKLIDKARLRAVPHATLSIEAKQMMNK
ncbi:MAG: TraR/DksA C4-type zinc finger protein [Chitinophagaceae bacterium]